jgi:ABC-type bacteriocin/lantibiotic exporter with double-glycine peptidase domain
MAISTFLINTCVQSLLLWVGMMLVEENQMSSEILIAFMLVSHQVRITLRQSAGSTNTFSSIKISFR